MTGRLPLYTSLTRIKEELRSGARIAMTPVPESARPFIDPAFTIGAGALTEDPILGLRCPVRECGKYFHMLTPHLNKAHRGIGGAAAVREALDIPKPTGLLSQRQAAIQTRGILAHYAKPECKKARKARLEAARLNVAPVFRRGPRHVSVMEQNLRNRCIAQLQAKMMDLAHKIKREPSFADLRTEYGTDIFYHIRNAFGSLENLRAQLQMANPPKFQWKRVLRDAVADSFDAFFEANGRWPTESDIADVETVPMVPRIDEIMAAYGTSTWSEAWPLLQTTLRIRGVLAAS